MTAYHFMEADNQDFIIPLVNDDTIDQATTTRELTGLWKWQSELILGWKVMPKNGSGAWQEWSAVYDFYTNRSGEETIATTGGVTFDMRFVEAGDYYVGGQTGDYDYAVNSNQTLTNGFWIAETEVTYELWYEVYQWATDDDNGDGTPDDDASGDRDADGGALYTFANPGREGHDGTDGDAPTSGAKLEPVTSINWRDAMVWCNALSEKMELDCVYHTDSGLYAPIRTVTDTATLDTTAGAEDNPYVDWDANGYRLPREVEWEIAARGANPSGGTYGTTYAGSNMVGDVAWYSGNSGNSTQDVATQPGTESDYWNEIGLYDMSGNVLEWCWDWYDGSYPTESSDCDGPASGSSRILRYGGYNYVDYGCEVDFRGDGGPYFGNGSCGFRPVRTAQ